MLTGTDVDGAFDDATDLAGLLAGSQMVRSCLARQWFRFGLGRNAELAEDAESLLILDEAATRDDIREIIVALTTTDAFRLRAWDTDESDRE